MVAVWAMAIVVIVITKGEYSVAVVMMTMINDESKVSDGCGLRDGDNVEQLGDTDGEGGSLVVVMVKIVNVSVM